MLNKLIAVALLGGIIATSSCSTNSMLSAADIFGKDALISSLTSNLGVDAKQAAGGLGSIMSFARNKLPSADYNALARYLPDAGNYLRFAQDAGILDDPIGTLAGLHDTMQSLGISPSTANRMYDAVGDYLGEVGGESAKSILMGLLS